MPYLVLVRHGESKWNKKGLWTGWTDIELDKEGRERARTAGRTVADIHFKVAFTSKLKRAQQSLEEMQTQLKEKNFPTIENKALNERDYGDLTGKNKWQVKKEIGEEEFLKIRRSWDFPPPGGESLKDVYQRVAPYYQKEIEPYLRKGEDVLVVAHGNSLRALIKYLENISNNDIPNLEMQTGEVDIYKLDNQGKILNKAIKNTNLGLVQYLLRFLAGQKITP